MKDIKKLMITLVALLAVTTGAWADYTVTWEGTTLQGIAVKNNTATTSQTVEGITVTASNGYFFYNTTYPAGPVFTASSSADNGLVFSAENNIKSIAITFTEMASYGGSMAIGAGAHTYQVSPAAKSFALPKNDAYNGITKVVFTLEGDAPASGPEVSGPTIVEGKPQWTFTQPAGNVTVSVEYYDLATLANEGLTAAEDAAAKTEAPLAVVADGAVTGGTLMYYVALDENFSQADAIALAETQWSADIPTAETIDAAGTYYVWYYIKGDDEHSDTDPQRLEVTVLPEPTYTVEFAEGTPESDKWTADPAAGVTKGTAVTVTYTGTKKVIGVKAEKKAKPAGIVNPVVGQVIGSDGNNYDANATLPDGVTKVAMIAYVSGSNGLALALTDEGIYTWDKSSPSNKDKTAPEICSALNTSKAVTGGTWKLPSKDEWKQMFKANGGDEDSYTGLNNALAAAGGESSKLLESEEYWSSSEVEGGDAWLVNLEDGNASWDTYGKHYSRYVRACLAF